MATKERQWTIEKVHGAWWAYWPPRPNDMQFVTHTTRANNILGPFYSEAYAKEQLARHLAGVEKYKAKRA